MEVSLVAEIADDVFMVFMIKFVVVDNGFLVDVSTAVLVSIKS